eukprot:TRINITY_DN50226_c0_g1_i1.p1 TRINITY_DN50226_c0_g1~~TRINITY_DN50226_c0_g1_i1.p1  ORF type:complete len:263 (-),score=94.67 TRINITY_DN50226_c0_g1_i1:363-1085(-)
MAAVAPALPTLLKHGQQHQGCGGDLSKQHQGIDMEMMSPMSAWENGCVNSVNPSGCASFFGMTDNSKLNIGQQQQQQPLQQPLPQPQMQEQQQPLQQPQPCMGFAFEPFPGTGPAVGGMYFAALPQTAPTLQPAQQMCGASLLPSQQVQEMQMQPPQMQLQMQPPLQQLLLPQEQQQVQQQQQPLQQKQQKQQGPLVKNQRRKQEHLDDEVKSNSSAGGRPPVPAGIFIDLSCLREKSIR